MKRSTKIILGFLAVLVIIQFIKPEKNQSVLDPVKDVFNDYPATDSTKQLIVSSCYDCHSNNTYYPWYSTIQPVAWWLDSHVQEGKAELNFSEFITYDAKKADHKLEETIEMVKEKEMPLESYTWIHDHSRLTDAQRDAIINWAEEARKKIVP